MGIVQVLVARTLQGCFPTLESGLRGIEKRKSEIDAEFHAAHSSQKRLFDCRPGFGRGLPMLPVLSS